MLRRLLILSLALAALTVPAAPAMASATAGYAPPGGSEQAQVQGAVRSTAPQSSGRLPFTGLDVGLMLAGGVFLLGTGVLLARATRRAPQNL